MQYKDFGYIISSHGDKFNRTNVYKGNDKGKGTIYKVECGGMNRYYYTSNYDEITSVEAKCNKRYNEYMEDDFDDFIVTTKLNSVKNNVTLSLSESNYIVESLERTNNIADQIVYPYPNMYYKYTGNDKLKLRLNASISRKEFDDFTLTIDESKDGYVHVMERMNEERRFIYEITSSKPIINFINSTKIHSQSSIILKGVDGMYISNSEDKMGTQYLCKIKSITKEKSYCMKCKEGYKLNSENECILNENEEIKEIDEKCEGTDGYSCYKCKNGYKLTQEGKCEEYEIEINQCEKRINDEICEKCEENYYVNQEYACKIKDSKCKEYNGLECHECEIGYYLNNANECISGNDSKCKYEGEECKICEYGYEKNNNGVCEKNQNIIQCLYDEYLTTGSGECLKCREKYENCEICDEKECKKCQENYQFNGTMCSPNICPEYNYSTINIYGECVTEVENCEIMDEFYCIQCNEDYYLDINTGECINKTLRGCKEFNTNGCYSCEDGYYLSKSKF